MKKMFSLALLSTAAMLVSCWTDGEGKIKNPDWTIEPGTAGDFQKIREDALRDMMIMQTFDAATGIDFTSPKGVRFTLSSMWHGDWTQVTGDVTLEYIELFDRGSMVVGNKPLKGEDAAGNLIPLITGGEFYINVTQNGESVFGYYNMVIPGSLTGGVDKRDGLDPMTLWLGEIDDETGDLFWKEFGTDGRDGNKEGGVWPDGESNNYNLFGSDFGWINVDVLSGEEGEKTPLLVSVPEGYDNTNASVYVAYVGQTDRLAFLDVYSPANKLFTEHYGWAPIGFELYVIFTAEENGQFVYSIKKVTIAKETIIYVTQAELLTGTRDEVIAAINALP